MFSQYFLIQLIEFVTQPIHAITIFVVETANARISTAQPVALACPARTESLPTVDRNVTQILTVQQLWCARETSAKIPAMAVVV